ncbi:MAG: hypothetical protein RLN80_01540 [Rhodospirillales bacterium]
MPSNTTLSEWLEEAFGLERSGQTVAALAAFTLAASHWPEAAAPLVAAANIEIEADRLQEARVNLQAAVYRQRENPVALNNLAHVQMLQGDLQEAEINARRAVEYATTTGPIARETLAEILALKQQRK